MDGQKGQAKLTRTHSSLLRSSPTVRSSVHSLASVAEEDYLVSSSDEEKKAKKSPKPALSFKPGSTRFAPVLAVTSLTLFAFVYFFYHYKKLDETPTSENLLLALIFIAVALFFFSKHRTLINRSFSILRRWSEENANWIGLSRTNSKPVQWSIGDSDFKKVEDEEESRLVKEGVICYTNGDIYEGEFHKGKCNGSGVYNYFSSGRYEGDWVDGKYDGYGIESWSRGSRYRGQYRQGLRHGYGVYRFYTGDTYAGEWCNGQSQGIGVQTCSDGSCYVGQFKFGVKHGLGCYHFRNGDRYSGEYFGDKVHGFGVYHFANGHCYEGSWHEGRKQGYGMYTFRNSDARCGEWDCGNLKTPLLPLSEPALRAVQAARRTADSAIHLRRVDGEVNKAVMAANRAATAARVAAVKAVQNRMEGKFCDTDFLDSSFV